MVILELIGIFRYKYLVVFEKNILSSVPALLYLLHPCSRRQLLLRCSISCIHAVVGNCFLLGLSNDNYSKFLSGDNHAFDSD